MEKFTSTGIGIGNLCDAKSELKKCLQNLERIIFWEKVILFNETENLDIISFLNTEYSINL